jgi:phenylacetate-CoA ligase
MFPDAFKERLPYALKQSLSYLSASFVKLLRSDREFEATHGFLQESQWWSADRLREYQLSALQRIVAHCYHNVPYYRSLFDRIGITPGSVKTFSDIERLPLLTKEDVKKNLPNLCACNIPKRQLRQVTTGGSTGMPMSLFYRTRTTASREMAFVWRHWKWAGVTPRDRFVVIRGNRLENERWWKYDPRDRSLYLSSFLMSKGNLPRYLARIVNYGPAVVRGYPSSLYQLSRFIASQGITISNVKCVLTSSESLPLDQRQAIERAFGAKVYDHYGHVEICACIMQCEQRRYHIMPEYGYVELLDEEGRPVREEGRPAEIIATGFLNDAMPLLRYRTGDIAIVSSEVCPCGRNFPTVKSIQGRAQDFVVDRTGQHVTFTCSDEALWGIEEPISAYQYVQEEPGKLVLRLEMQEDLERGVYEAITERFHRKFATFDLSIEAVRDIPRTVRGKFRYLVQKIQIPR